MHSERRASWRSWLAGVSAGVFILAVGAVHRDHAAKAVMTCPGLGCMDPFTCGPEVGTQCDLIWDPFAGRLRCEEHLCNMEQPIP